MKYGIIVSEKNASQEGINLSAFTDELKDIDIVPVFVDKGCSTISWKDGEGSHRLSMGSQQLERESNRNIPPGEHVGLMEILARSLPVGSVVMFKDTWTVSKHPDLFFHIYQQFRKRNISIQFIDTFWLSSDVLRCVGLSNPDVETQLILNLVNLTYQNHDLGDEDVIQYNALPYDSGRLKKNREGGNPYRIAT